MYVKINLKNFSWFYILFEMLFPACIHIFLFKYDEKM